MKDYIHFVSITIFNLFFSRLDAQHLISSRQPDGLAVSTGNVYFTSHDAAGATLWRTSQNSNPGKESVLYWESGARFGDIIFAKINNTFFGYFFAKKSGVISIKRVSLSGGNATTLTTVTNIDIDNSHHNLVTDGTNLYWQDVNSIRKMSINGGSISILDQTTPNTPTAGIDLQNNKLIYADGRAIRVVSTTGDGSPTTITQASEQVSTLRGAILYVYWGERSGALRRKAPGLSTETIQNSSGYVPISIATYGSAFAWTQCGSALCQLKGSSGTIVSLGADAIGIFLTSASKVFWGDAAGIHSLPFHLD
jgi:hypothetical protein